LWLNLTTVISLRVPSGPSRLLLIYAIFDLGSPQKSPQSSRSRIVRAIVRAMDECTTHAMVMLPNWFQPVRRC
jgi:hypothetical protein